MCYPCTHCGLCGKQNEDSPYYTPPATIPCLKCGAVVDPATGVCVSCGNVAFAPVRAGANGGFPRRHSR